MMNRVNINKILLGGFIILIFFISLLLNRLYPLYWDDWRYAFIQSGDFRTDRILNFSDIIYSQYEHYLCWGGRIVVHFIAQFLIWLNPLWHDIINSLAYTTLIYFIYLFSNRGRRINAYTFIFISILMWFFIPKYVNTVLSVTVSANYVWGTLIALLIIYPYYSFYVLEKTTHFRFKSLVFFLLGAISGCTNEHTALAVIASLFFFCILFKRKRNLTNWAIWGCIGTTVGFLIMVLAPGNFVRTARASEGIQSFWSMLEANFMSMILSKFSYLLPLIILYLLILIFYIKGKGGIYNLAKKDKKVISMSLLFMLMSQISFWTMIISPEFPFRALFSISTLQIISIGIIYSNLSMNFSFLKQINQIFLVVIFIVFIGDIYRKSEVIYMISDTFKKREYILKKQRQKGIQDIVFHGRIYAHPKFDFYDLRQDPEFAFNRYYAAFYNVRSVSVTEDRSTDGN